MSEKIGIALFLFCILSMISASFALYSIPSAKSALFEPLRPRREPTEISECGIVTDPYGSLAKTFKVGTIDEGSTCTWELRAPYKHIINIISVAYDFEDPVETKYDSMDFKQGSTISLYDSDKTYMTGIDVHPYRKAGVPIIQSLSTQEHMTVQITYHAHVGYRTQVMKINYEFLDKDKVREQLLKDNRKPTGNH